MELYHVRFRFRAARAALFLARRFLVALIISAPRESRALMAFGFSLFILGFPFDKNRRQGFAS